MLASFKTFQIDRMDIDEMVYLVAVGEQLRKQYKELALEEPEFVDTNLKALKREIASRTAEIRDSRIKELRLQIDGLKTTKEKREALEDELRSLTKAE